MNISINIRMINLPTYLVAHSLSCLCRSHISVSSSFVACLPVCLYVRLSILSVRNLFNVCSVTTNSDNSTCTFFEHRSQYIGPHYWIKRFKGQGYVSLRSASLCFVYVTADGEWAWSQQVTWHR